MKVRMKVLIQFRIGETDFFLGRTAINLEGHSIECVEIKQSRDDEVELISLESLDDEGQMRGNLTDRVLEWMYMKAKQPYVSHEPYLIWLATGMRIFVESQREEPNVEEK